MTGGSLGWITRLPGLGEWGRLGAYRMVQIAAAAEACGSRPGASWTPMPSAAGAPTRWCSRPARAGPADGLNGFTRAPDPRRRRALRTC